MLLIDIYLGQYENLQPLVSRNAVSESIACLEMAKTIFSSCQYHNRNVMGSIVRVKQVGLAIYRICAYMRFLQL